MTTRIDTRFAELAREGRAALVTFVMGGDPDLVTSLALLKALPAAGADVIELGMPFTDPMADGPAIQAAGLRALAAHTTLAKVLKLAAEFRKTDAATPLILMAITSDLCLRVPRFLTDAKAAGVDGVIVVDLPPEEDSELCLRRRRRGLPLSGTRRRRRDDARLPAVLAHTAGFVYYVSITGITGAATPDYSKVAACCRAAETHTALPVAVGFGVKNAETRPLSRKLRMASSSARRWSMRCGVRSTKRGGRARAASRRLPISSATLPPGCIGSPSAGLRTSQFEFSWEVQNPFIVSGSTLIWPPPRSIPAMDDLKAYNRT